MKNIYIAGHKGMVGSAIFRKLSSNHEVNIITRDRGELDLTNQQQTNVFFDSVKIDQVYLAGAKVGGILANNSYPADFIYDNLLIQANIIHAAHQNGVKQLLFLGSSCIYPKLAEQPMSEESLLTGTLEPTNEPYAIAKIAGIKLCESYNRQYGVDYRSVMPTNLYGPNDNFHPENSHVIPAMMRRFHEAKQNKLDNVEVWGSGSPKREFLHVDDMADACLAVMDATSEKYQSVTETRNSHINIGTGVDCSIRELALTMKRVVGYEGKITFDISKPDGAPRKLLNVSRAKLIGWSVSKNLEAGLKDTYDWFLSNVSTIRI